MSLSWSKWYKLQFFFVNSLQDSLGWSSLKQVQKHKRMSKRWTKAVNFISSLSPIRYVLFHSKATFFFYWRVMSSLLVKFALSAHFQSILYSNQWQICLKLIIFLIILQLSKHVGDDNVSYIYSVSSFVFNS